MKKASPNITTILLIGMMLLVLAIISVLANENKKREADEIVFEPVVVEITEGNATLKIDYDVKDSLGFQSEGEEEIDLTIIKDEDTPDRYIVEGTLSSTQRVDIGAQDQGKMCWYNILHQVDYIIFGTFTPSTCKFELYVDMKPSASRLLSHDCSVELGVDFSSLYMAPPPENLVFTKPFAGPALSSLDYHLFLFNVSLPSGVNCPAFSK